MVSFAFAPLQVADPAAYLAGSETAAEHIGGRHSGRLAGGLSFWNVIEQAIGSPEPNPPEAAERTESDDQEQDGAIRTVSTHFLIPPSEPPGPVIPFVLTIDWRTGPVAPESALDPPDERASEIPSTAVPAMRRREPIESSKWPEAAPDNLAAPSAAPPSALNVSRGNDTSGPEDIPVKAVENAFEPASSLPGLHGVQPLELQRAMGPEESSEESSEAPPEISSRTYSAADVQETNDPQARSQAVRMQLAAVVRIAHGEGHVRTLRADRPLTEEREAAVHPVLPKGKALKCEVRTTDISRVTAPKYEAAKDAHEVPPQDADAAGPEQNESDQVAGAQPRRGSAASEHSGAKDSHGSTRAAEDRHGAPSEQSREQFEFTTANGPGSAAPRSSSGTDPKTATAQHADRPRASGETLATAGSPVDRDRASGKAERIAIRVDGGADGPVEIRLQERRGEVHLSLRAAAPEMVEQIRESLPQLSERLQAEGFDAETWRPDDSPRGRSAMDEAASHDLNREGRGRHDRHDSEPQHSRGSRSRGDEQFADMIGMEGEQE